MLVVRPCACGCKGYWEVARDDTPHVVLAQGFSFKQNAVMYARGSTLDGEPIHVDDMPDREQWQPDTHPLASAAR